MVSMKKLDTHPTVGAVPKFRIPNAYSDRHLQEIT